ncbi:hypothetical protein LXA43DRAFT_371255 [Ganoderma leucocontextum]|nr:hypothetical protein LXA43DRAFT_371255 [Ganoderma leucocontextum]
MHVAEPKDTSAKDLTTTAAPKNDRDDHQVPSEAAEPSSQLRGPDELPPPYTPSAQRSDTPASRRGPPCTCPRPPDRGGNQTAANPSDPKGTNWKAIGGAAAVAVAVPTLAVAGAALALPAIGFASTGVVGGSIAAGVQSLVYGGSTCGVFSILQSVGATIVAPSLISTATAAGCATAGGVAIRNGIQKPDEGGEDANGGNGGGQNATRAECSCAGCVCDESCECACRRRRAARPER